MDNAEVLRRVQQLRKALAEKRKKLEKQEAKLSRRTSALSSTTEPRQHQEESQTDAALGPSSPSPACRSPSPSFRVEEEEIPLSLFQSQFFPSLFTQPSQTDRPQDCTVLCVPRATASLSEDEQTIDFVTARSSAREPPSLATCLTSRGTALVFVLRTPSTDVVPLWRKSASEGTKPLAVCLITLPSTPSGSTRVGLFLLCFHVHQEVLINCLYVAEVTEEGTWNLLDSLILPISVKSRVSAVDVSSLTGCADAVFVTGLGFIIAIVVPAIGLTATFRASLEVETGRQSVTAC
ncbi:unnamed protein product [Dibothriocephalus latus]|uniref:Uncharacterized protein n=1 Tax=Dibothriocephalus latus TaxID=60516 RepID=A0A3P7N8E3_DIBLA|nr:unnamed protein product [Dibothriocephalus latus]